MDDWWRKEQERQLNETWRQNQEQMAHHRAIKFSIKQIREMTDEQLLGLLSGETKPTGTLYHDTLHLLSYELNRREMQRATRPHWTITPAFWFTVIAAATGVIGIVVAIVVAILQAKSSAP